MENTVRYKYIIANMVSILCEKGNSPKAVADFLIGTGVEPEDLIAIKGLFDDVYDEFIKRWNEDEAQFAEWAKEDKEVK